MLGIDVLNIYTYGSRVYGNINLYSDNDYIIVTDSIEIPKKEFHLPLTDITAYTSEEFKKQIDNHNISVLECLFLDKNLKYESIKFDFVLDLTRLRESISSITSNSWVKCNKKLTIENEIRIGLKSLFHVFRIYNFGIQIAKYNKITDYSICNNLYKEIMNSDPENQNWDFIKNKYQKDRNALASEFKLLTHKM